MLAIALGLTQTTQAQMNSLCDSTWYEVSFGGGMGQMNLWDITLTGYYDTTIHNYGVDTVTHTFSVENNTWVGSSGYTIFDMNLSLYDTLSICWMAELWLTPTNSLFNWEWCQDTAQGYTQCDDWVYNFQTQAWVKSTEMQQQPYFCCDSITYWTDQGQGLFVGLDTTNIIHNPDSINVTWSVCDESYCYNETGMDAFFGQITTTDTIKVCYEAWLYEMNTMEICTQCDSLVFNQNVYNWVPLSMSSQPLSINELTFNKVNDNKIYDMLGKELLEAPLGQMYIQNRKLYFRNE